MLIEQIIRHKTLSIWSFFCEIAEVRRCGYHAWILAEESVLLMRRKIGRIMI